MPVYLAIKQKRLQNRQQFQDNFYRIGFLNPQDAEIYAQKVSFCVMFFFYGIEYIGLI